MKKSNLVCIIIGVVSIVASIGVTYGYHKGIESKNILTVNDNKDNINDSEEKNSTNDLNKENNNQTEQKEDDKAIQSNDIKEDTSKDESSNIDQNSALDELKKGKKVYSDKLNIADKEYEQIQYQLQTDANLSQGAMNGLAGKQYKIYDDVLNEMYQYLRRNLPNERAEELKQAQINWIEYKEKSIEESWPQKQGSMGPLVMNGTGATLTKERCYEILNTYFD